MQLLRFTTLIVALTALAACDGDTTEPRPLPVAPPLRSDTTFRSGYVLRDGSPMFVRYHVVDGRAIFEGDIDLGPAVDVAQTLDELHRITAAPGVHLGVVTTNLGERWPGGIVPYTIAGDVADPSRVTNAFASVEAAVHGVHFIPRTSETDFVSVVRTTDPDFCGFSPVGRKGGAQLLQVKDGCVTGKVIHEAAHALGMWHEQSRCDRDTYVEILATNVKDGQLFQFDKQCSGATDVFDYDEGSIMHYGIFDLSKEPGVKQTIRSKRGLDALMGQRTALSNTDVKTIDWMYHPYAVTGVGVTYPGNRATISWNARSGATGYVVTLVTRVYISDYENGSSEQEFRRLAGTTTSLSVQDFSSGYGTYTGTDVCHYDTGTSSETDTYWYEVVAQFPGAPSLPATYAAFVAQC